MLTVSHLNQYYGGSHILRNLSFSAEAGKVTAILGRNGVGKSTLLKSLMGLLPTKSGTIEFAGRDITRARRISASRRHRLRAAGTRDLSPPDGAGEPADGAGHLSRQHAVPERIFEMFPVLRQMLRRRGGDLSGGQQQQLAIGRALAMGPKLLILDEPTEGIQPSIIKDIERAVRSLAASGEMAILLVEQYYDFARSLADQYLVMERGEIIMRGRGEDMEKDGVLAALAV
jgi:urea transport system ATP-binding protein